MNPTKHTAFFLVLVGLAAPATALADRPLCTIVGSYSYDKFDKALAKVDVAKAAGFTETAVFDTRQSDVLAWGGLAVVALRTSDKAAARASVRTLKKAKIKAYVRGCDLANAKPVSKRAELDALPTLSKTRITLDYNDLDAGCLGWSKALGQVACVVGTNSIQEANDYRLVFLPNGETFDLPLIGERDQAMNAPPIAVPQGERAKLRAIMKKGEFVALPDPVRSLTAAGSVAIALPRTGIRLKRSSLGEGGDGETGSWPIYDDTVEAKCGGGYVELLSL
ncbi:MAG: hypothetical protein ACI9OJ_000945, partial [Myxococcota bacterium]